MKKLFLAVMAIGMAANVQAQNNVKCNEQDSAGCCKQSAEMGNQSGHRGHGPFMPFGSLKERTEHMTKHFGLTPDQKAKVQKLNEEYADIFTPKMKPGEAPNAQSKQGARQQLSEEILAKRKEYREKLSEILTDEQRQKMQRPHHPGHGNRPAQPAK